MKLEGLKVGTQLVVRNGARGEQVAVISGHSRYGATYVRKWLMRGARWTAPVTIYPSEVLRYAGPDDFRKRRVKAMAPVG